MCRESVGLDAYLEHARKPPCSGPEVEALIGAFREAMGSSKLHTSRAGDCETYELYRTGAMCPRAIGRCFDAFTDFCRLLPSCAEDGLPPRIDIRTEAHADGEVSVLRLRLPRPRTWMHLPRTEGLHTRFDEVRADG